MTERIARMRIALAVVVALTLIVGLVVALNPTDPNAATAVWVVTHAGVQSRS